MKTVIALIITLATTIALTGCNTISGIGKDVQKVGQVVTSAGGK
ncbi:entericidin A/B family lipoprotein [Duganella sp. FT92W]|uniref:Entericidin A/B family lipoprotein n=1 Tax=Pseudoduganella rivuli TaxID=2666085 RepID=A0A7X2LWL2_9BURK|nr:entericidin A/B family lipoprotein [Pseudoduganella rivuli]MRV75014.1 entericidin A/B family lipoprotein [Pseudoduganella rivuli]